MEIQKMLEIGQSVGTPVAWIFIMLIAYKLFEIFSTFIKTLTEVVIKFVEKHFQHIDNMEKELQEISRINSTNTAQFTQALNAVNQTVTMQNGAINQNTQDIKPLVQTVNKVEQVIRHCENMSKRGE